jgi:PAS domain S-box-containing protein
MTKNANNLIVIAEDSLTQAEQLKHILTKNRYRVLHGRNGKDAFDLIRKNEPLLVISDIIMPEINGYELCRMIKTDDLLKEIPVILLTVLSDPSDVIKGLECGADNFIIKPYKEKYLLSRIHNILINRELRKEQLSEMGIDIFFANTKHFITSNRLQILDLLLSTYENSIQKNEELINTNEKLKSTRDELKALNKNLEKLVEERTRRLKHINSVLESLRNVNQIIVREKNAGTLIKKICSALVRTRGYNGIWILLFDGNMHLTTYAGKGYANEFYHIIKEIKNEKLPHCIQQGLKQHGIVLTQSKMTECADCPMSQKDNYKNSLTVRLEYNGEIFGILTIKLSSDIQIDEEEYDLLSEIAGDISFAFYSINLEEKHRQAEDAFRKSEEKYKILFENSAEGILVADIETRKFYYSNPAICKMLGYTGDEFLGMDITNIHPKNSLDSVLSEFEAQIMGEKTLANNIPCLRKDGTIIYANINASTAMIDGRNCSIGFFTDVTELRMMENELILAKEKAEEANKLKSAFLANMSHEIRTPMNAILGFSGLLSDAKITKEKKEEYIARIKESGDRLLHLVDDIIDSSKIEAGQLIIKEVEVPVQKLLTELCSLFEEQKRKKEKENIEIRLNKTIRSENVKIHTDPYRLKQILSNLMDNALKYTDSGYIEVGYDLLPVSGNCKDRAGTEPINRTLQFYVKDTGIGFPASQKDFIFERFTKIENQKIKLYEGAGLGLTISKNLVNLLGGEIRAESALGKGSTFFFTLPCHPVSAIRDDVPSENAVIDKSRKSIDYKWKDKIILVAEDEENNFQFISEVLKNTRVQLIRATTGEEVIEICKSDKVIDLILMDVKMPVMDGYTATRSVKKIRKKLPVIALTAYAGEREKEESIQAGCADYLPKPVKYDKLLKMISKYI